MTTFQFAIHKMFPAFADTERRHGRREFLERAGTSITGGLTAAAILQCLEPEGLRAQSAPKLTASRRPQRVAAIGESSRRHAGGFPIPG